MRQLGGAANGTAEVDRTSLCRPWSRRLCPVVTGLGKWLSLSVMSKKETAERLNQDTVDSNPIRRGRIGQRRLEQDRPIHP
ncbi:jg18387 [Pararge aegeria aegeria]|uniref:Jg18387 protein n=1 Tax=Pararge aegeria aegeria TaxID=348720 RepID=A0A8S4QEF3_9NEOP|nr:jg18387 [Pararge aegeria aegeria]